MNTKTVGIIFGAVAIGAGIFLLTRKAQAATLPGTAPGTLPPSLDVTPTATPESRTGGGGGGAPKEAGTDLSKLVDTTIAVDVTGKPDIGLGETRTEVSGTNVVRTRRQQNVPSARQSLEQTIRSSRTNMMKFYVQALGYEANRTNNLPNAVWGRHSRDLLNAARTMRGLPNTTTFDATSAVRDIQALAPSNIQLRSLPFAVSADLIRDINIEARLYYDQARPIIAQAAGAIEITHTPMLEGNLADMEPSA